MDYWQFFQILCNLWGKVLSNEVFESQVHFVDFIGRSNHNCLIKLVKNGLELILLVLSIFEAQEHFLLDSLLEMHEHRENYYWSSNRGNNKILKRHLFSIILIIFAEYVKDGLRQPNHHYAQCYRSDDKHAFI